MHKRSSIVTDQSWLSDNTRTWGNSEKRDFINKCTLLYPAFIDFLHNSRQRGDESHDVVRRRLYDFIRFRKTDSAEFIDRVLSAVAHRAFDEKIMTAFTTIDQYLHLLKTAYDESRDASKNT